MCKNRQRSADSITEEFLTSTSINVSTKTVQWDLLGMSFHGRAAAFKPLITKFNAKPWSGVCKARRHWTGLWNNGNVFSGVMNVTSLFGSQMCEYGFGGCQENVTCVTALCQL